MTGEPDKEVSNNRSGVTLRRVGPKLGNDFLCGQPQDGDGPRRCVEGVLRYIDVWPPEDGI